MSLRLFNGDTALNQLPLTWNTVKSNNGVDVLNGACSDSARYMSNPCNGYEVQEWAWVFTPDTILLTCDSGIQYMRQVGAQDSESCKMLGSGPVDTLEFTNMEGFAYRAFPIHGVIKDESSGESEREPRSEISENEEGRFPRAEVSNLIKTDVENLTRTDVENLTRADVENLTVDAQTLPTCNCWTRECNYCSDLECAVKHDMTTSHQVISVTSQVDRTVLNSIVLYNKEGVQLGKFQWNLRGIFLTGCVGCRTPRQIRRLVNSDAGASNWEVSLNRRRLTLRVRGVGSEDGSRDHVYQQRLIGECAEHYSEVSYFSFYNMDCDTSFTPTSEMLVGSRVSESCGGTCSAM